MSLSFVRRLARGVAGGAQNCMGLAVTKKGRKGSRRQSWLQVAWTISERVAACLCIMMLALAAFTLAVYLSVAAVTSANSSRLKEQTLASHLPLTNSNSNSNNNRNSMVGSSKESQLPPARPPKFTQHSEKGGASRVAQPAPAEPRVPQGDSNINPTSSQPGGLSGCPYVVATSFGGSYTQVRMGEMVISIVHNARAAGGWQCLLLLVDGDVAQLFADINMSGRPFSDAFALPNDYAEQLAEAMGGGAVDHAAVEQLVAQHAASLASLVPDPSSHGGKPWIMSFKAQPTYGMIIDAINKKVPAGMPVVLTAADIALDGGDFLHAPTAIAQQCLSASGRGANEPIAAARAAHSAHEISWTLRQFIAGEAPCLRRSRADLQTSDAHSKQQKRFLVLTRHPHALCPAQSGGGGVAAVTLPENMCTTPRVQQRRGQAVTSYVNSADTFVFSAPLSVDTARLAFMQNRLGAENRFAFEVKSTGDYIVEDPCSLFRTYHLHCTKERASDTQQASKRIAGKTNSVNFGRKLYQNCTLDFGISDSDPCGMR